MGMAASQARFLGLTARQNNVEFEGQQINQQRTMLSNESANYYNDLLGMTVPIPPSVDSYTKTAYTFSDGSLTNTITSMIAQSNGTYTVSYLSKWQDDYTPVSAATSVVTRTGTQGDYTYSIGAVNLRKLATIGANTITAVVGNTINIGGKSYAVKQDADGYYIEQPTVTGSKRACTPQEIEDIEYYQIENDLSDGQRVYKDNSTGGFYALDDSGNRSDLDGVTENDLVMILYDGSFANPEYAINLVEKDANGDYIREVYENTVDKEYLTQAQIDSITTYEVNGDPYLSSLSQDDLKATIKEEEAWAKLLEQKYGSNDWYIRYVTDTTTGMQKPYFYEGNSLENAKYDEKTSTSLSCINCYTIGSEQKIAEFRGVENCKIEKDSSGRLITLSIPKEIDGETIYTEYALTTETTTDQEAYNDAMNQYEYNKYLYDQAVENINSKIEIIQAEDKNLELRLKQLDTEQKAIQTEKEAVSKVIQKNTDDTFKTFNA